MARDTDLLHRMYGERPPAPAEPPRGAVGAVPAVWILGLLAAGLGSAAVSVGLLVAAALLPPPPLQVWGVIEPEEWLLAVHDHSEARDGSAGCVLTGQRLVRFDDRAPTASVDLSAAEIELSDHAVAVRDPDGAAVTCPFDLREDPRPFAAEIRKASRVRTALHPVTPLKGASPRASAAPEPAP